MSMRREATMRREFCAQLNEGFSLGFRQTGAEVGLVRRGNELNLFQQASAFRRQLQLLVPAILPAALPRNQPVRLKLIQQQHQATGENPKMRRELTLVFPGIVADPTQDADVRWRNTESFDLAAKGQRRVRPDLRQQKPERPRSSAR
jgi:hypothetical protein